MSIKEKKPRKPKQTKSEAEIAREYATRIMHRQITRGHVGKRFKDLGPQKTTEKDLWMDTDFFFSVVFQSSQQKYAFLDAFCKQFGVQIEAVGEDRIQVLNGLKLAEQMKINLVKESIDEPPYGSLELRPYVLDTEKC